MQKIQCYVQGPIFGHVNRCHNQSSQKGHDDNRLETCKSNQGPNRGEKR
jgi:hypothetical protein